VVDTWAKDEPAKDSKDSSAAAKPDDPDRPRLVRAAAPDSSDTATAKPEASAEKVPPRSVPDADDPGPPRLSRGRPADTTREHAGDPPAAETAAARLPPPMVEQPPAPAAETAGSRPSVRRGAAEEDSIPIVRHSEDLIRRASDAALDFTETLPAYVCQEMMSRYQSESHPASWQALDVVSMNVVYENGKEDYRNLAVNGRATNKSMDELGGAWSTGEFGTVLIDLFSPATAADFRPNGDSRTGGITAKLYDFSVTREHSHWDIHMGAQTYQPAYKGSVWIDPQTARVLRIEMQAIGFPASFPTDDVESATDYQYIRLGDARQYLLPVHAETLSCQRGSPYCSRNTIDFRNYHKYTGESTITFGDPKDPVKK